MQRFTSLAADESGWFYRMRIILASGSPRRSELMKLGGFDFDVIVPDVDESICDGVFPKDAVMELSARKASAVFDICVDADVIVAADTVVSIDNEILGKPKSREEASEMLKKLSGRTHKVFTGVTIIKNGDANTFFSESSVSFYELAQNEIESYLDTGEYTDKAGSYAIQGRGCVLVKEISGDYYNIVGLPIAEVSRAILK